MMNLLLNINLSASKKSVTGRLRLTFEMEKRFGGCRRWLQKVRSCSGREIASATLQYDFGVYATFREDRLCPPVSSFTIFTSC